MMVYVYVWWFEAFGPFRRAGNANVGLSVAIAHSTFKHQTDGDVA